jgi:starch phosphorylase
LGLEGNKFNYTLASLKFSGIANGVSKIHGEVAKQMWSANPGVCEIISITNAQNRKYWQDKDLSQYIASNEDDHIIKRKREMKVELFHEVEKITGKVFDPKVLTIVWARRFAGYKRADLLMYNWERFAQLMNNKETPVQVIWAGKPYPEDHQATAIFNRIVERAQQFANCAVLTGYELGLSAELKKGADVWLNNPYMYREASGTSGMTAAMNGAVNLSIPDGWVPEFARDKINCFVINPSTGSLSEEEINCQENFNLMETLENSVLPTYYDQPLRWVEIIKNAANDVMPEFESNRMAKEYYERLYN